MADLDADFDTSGPVEAGQAFILGILGTRTQIDKKSLYSNILEPLVDSIGKTPEQIILPSESVSSAYISLWADDKNIPTQALQADWFKLGRRAKFLRDSSIQQQATHYLVFEAPKSIFYEQLAVRLAKKHPGRVFTVDSSNAPSIAQLEVA